MFGREMEGRGCWPESCGRHSGVWQLCIRGQLMPIILLAASISPLGRIVYLRAGNLAEVNCCEPDFQCAGVLEQQTLGEGSHVYRHENLDHSKSLPGREMHWVLYIDLATGKGYKHVSGSRHKDP